MTTRLSIGALYQL